ncbi:MAG: hypothetical protein LBS52_09730 [Dysgonamonadaceae bacterium]|nr:hypothetical protein [Dysgonamonadaceae bacterium]
MKNTVFILTLAFCSFRLAFSQETLQSLAGKFETPSDEYRPMVWWHWLGSNFTQSGITKDLEAWKEAGIGGGCIFNITSSVQESNYPLGNLPFPTQTFRSPAYWEAVEHTMREAQRLGLTMGLHGTPGYSTTGGPWIDEVRGMKALISSKITVDGGKTIDIALPKPQLPDFTTYESRYTPGYTPVKARLYWDISVFAVPDKKNLTIEDVIELKPFTDADGHLKWDAPIGKWTIYRYGYAPTMAPPHPVPDDIMGKVLEVDKMSREDNIYHWRQVLEPLKEHIGSYFGNTFRYVWVDSYESGYQNWTPKFREEFIAIKGYDPLPWVALYQFVNKKDLQTHFSADNFEGNKIKSDLPEFQTFCKDYDNVVQRLFMDNGFAVAKEMLHEYGLKLYWEPYWGPFSTIEGTALADLPVDEFWTGNNPEDTVWVNSRIMRAAVETDKRVIGAEAFTGAPSLSKYTEDPAFLKNKADGGFASGKNLYFLHHWVHQPFDDRYQPGLGMGWWGTHFSRHQTWFKPAKAFFTYLARCQMLLQQGNYVLNDSRRDYFTHRRLPEGELFFVFNPAETLQKTVTFALENVSSVELWDAYTGKIIEAKSWRQRGDSVAVDLNLLHNQSMIVVFPNHATNYAKSAEKEVLSETTRAIDSAWKVTFTPKIGGKAFTKSFQKLSDWRESPNPDIKYFSGTAKYETSFVLPRSSGDNNRISIDLGSLEDIAELEINGRKVAVLWNPPYRADITDFVQPGKNTLRVYVTNNWANRLIGDEQYPADFEWGNDRGNDGRPMAAFPEWFVKNQARPQQGRKTFNLWYYYRKDSPLQPAGLLGPVKIVEEKVK